MVLSGGFNSSSETKVIQPALVVGQRSLAEIQEWQSQQAYARMELSKRWTVVRDNLKKGATIEDGPIRAWLEYQVIIVKGEKHTRVRLRVV